VNELARLVSFSFGFLQNYRIVDRDGNPWFAVKDICKILGIKNPSDAVKNFPEDEKAYVVVNVPDIEYPSHTSNVPGIESISHNSQCDIDSIYTTSAKSRARKTQKILIINGAGLYRLITRSDKPVARKLQDVIFKEILPAYRKHGINWASLPKTWPYQGQLYNHAEWRTKKEAAYFKRFPDATLDDFLKTLPF
jgi:prophage antirepressor-like protein